MVDHPRQPPMEKPNGQRVVCNFCKLGHQDVMDEKIAPEDFNLKGTEVIHKEEE